MSGPTTPRRLLAILRAPRCFALAALLFALSPFAPAAGLGAFFAHDVDVITVTDVTPEGRLLAAPSSAAPVRYMIVDVGEVHIGRNWAGEKLPNTDVARRWVMKALAKQNYTLATETNPPTQLLVFGWGYTSDPMLKFLGGEKADLMWEYEQYGGFLNPRVLTRNLQRVGIVGKIWDFAHGNLFVAFVRSYAMDSVGQGKKPIKLWETRFGCPADGLTLADTLPQMIVAAAPNFGRETRMPVSLRVNDWRRVQVEYGELRVIETDVSR